MRHDRIRQRIGHMIVTIGVLLVLPPAHQNVLSAAERRGTPVLISASVFDNSGNSPQMSAPRRSREIDQSTQRFYVGCDN